MRGQVVSQIISDSSSGITPADAGTRPRASQKSPVPSDHPRGCGDKRCSWRRNCGSHGSPPRMRGQVERAITVIEIGRITPADAGTSYDIDGSYGAQWDHPRGCGDKFSPLTARISCCGSPPRMRGQAGAGDFIPPCPGITPADAGTSSYWILALARAQDHPRGCGDK